MFDGLDQSVQPFLVEPMQLAAWAVRVRPHLEKMAEGSRGRYDATDILTAVAAGRMQLWLALHGAELLCVMVTQIENYPRCRAIRLIGLVGSRPRVWRGLLAGVEAAAKTNFGCQIAEAWHIPRFKAILPGYETTHWFSEKAL